MLAEVPPRVILDAGPLIGLFDRRDRHNADARRGFQQLVRGRAAASVPVPIVYEVYKWLVYEVSPVAARLGLARMRQNLQILPVERTDIDELANLVGTMPRWAGSLEDATVAMLGLRTETPVWTMNYRDLAAFRNLRFWTPA